MAERIDGAKLEAKTLGELISKRYPSFEISFGKDMLDDDITHGVEIETHDNSKYGYGVHVSIYPNIEWTDGGYRPYHYGGHHITLQSR